ncbi:hypothetical protein NEDG_00521 [Nematocida displodere]|uniref:RING-type domain-containing protein n=1 Tax=Nematocida displodere TaxID=1805483 RepID=A0A177EC40_9MICR|nr:hypothetical protein NEDG_00521 [Nematocida displodere]
MIGMVLVRCLKKLRVLLLRRSIACLGAWCMLAGCTSELVPGVDYILSDRTKETLTFFREHHPKLSCDELGVVQIGEETHMLKRQMGEILIILKKHKLGSVPQSLVEGVEYSRIRISTRNQGASVQEDLGVLAMILSAFGTICADSLELSDLKLGSWASGGAMARLFSKSPGEIALKSLKSGTLGRLEVPRCILRIKKLKIANSTELAIKWFQARVDMSQCRVNLIIDGNLELDTLEVVDGFGALAIVELRLYRIRQLSDLECKLLRKGPLPDTLVINSCFCLLTQRISEQICQNIVSNQWKRLHISKQLWKRLIMPRWGVRYICADLLTIDMTYFGNGRVFHSTPVPPMRNTIGLVKVLRIDFYEDRGDLTNGDLIRVLDWISRHFRGLVQIVLGTEAVLKKLVPFIEHNWFLILTNPGIASIKVADVECSLYQKKKGEFLCFSLSTWDLCKKGRLWEDLQKTCYAMLGFLSPEDQNRITCSGEVSEAGEDDIVCSICLSTLNELKDMNQTTPIDLCMLDKSGHTICSECLYALDQASRDTGSLACPVCRENIEYPVLRKKIKQTTQGPFRFLLSIASDDIEIISLPEQEPCKFGN